MTQGLVTRAGDSLQADGGTWRARGANIWDLLDSSPQEAAQRLTELKALELNSVRCWAFSKDGSARPEMLARLDAALAAADRAGIRLLLSLGNQWGDWGGPQCFGRTQDSWFRGMSPEWAEQARTVVARYRGHGAVLGWELLNELRPNADPDSMGWLDRAARLVKAGDPTHLVASGAEGFLPGLYPTADAESGASPDLSVQNLHPASVDIVTGHIYAKYLHPGFSPPEWRVAAALAGIQAAAGRRPVLLGEVGHDPRDPDVATGGRVRRDFITAVGRWSGRLGLAGGFLWSWGRPPAQSFNLAPGDPESELLLRTWQSLL